MLQASKNTIRRLALLAVIGVAVPFSASIYAQNVQAQESVAKEESGSQSQAFTPPNVPEPSAFNYVTIEQILAIDDQRAWQEEVRRAKEMGLTSPELELFSAHGQNSLHSGTPSVEQKEASYGISEQEREKIRQELIKEIRKEMQEIEEHNNATRAASKQMQDNQAVVDMVETARLVGVFGVGSALTAQVRYGDYDYFFGRHSKNNLRPHSGNELRLVSWQQQCVLLFDVDAEKEVKACIDRSPKEEAQTEAKK